MTNPLDINVDLTGVDSSIPVLAEQNVPLTVVETKVAPNKAQTGYNLNIKWATTGPAQSKDGMEVPPNFPLFSVHALQPAEDAKDPKGFMRGLAELCDALFGTDETNRPRFNQETFSSMVGRQCIAKVYPDEYPKGSGDFNTKVKRFRPATSS